jgi:RNA polymerase sigma-70 factor (ECF subfamily)
MNEKDLIARCIAHDEAAWAEFLKRYSDCIYGSVVNLLKKYSIDSADAAEDIYAAVLEKLLDRDCRALREFRWNSKLTTWLISITRNKAYDHLRSLGRRPTVSLDAPVSEDEDDYMSFIAADLDLDHEMEVKLTAEEALEKLPPGDKTILRFYYIEGLKEREIADLLGMSTDALSARKSRALAKLKNLAAKGRL